MLAHGSVVGTIGIVALAGALVSMLSGCGGSTRVVQRLPTGGELALDGNRKKAMASAHKHMAKHCHGVYTIVEEGEIVVEPTPDGPQDVLDVSDDQRADGREPELDEHDSVTREDERESDVHVATEWRLRYVCGQVAPPENTSPP